MEVERYHGYEDRIHARQYSEVMAGMPKDLSVYMGSGQRGGESSRSLKVRGNTGEARAWYTQEWQA